MTSNAIPAHPSRRPAQRRASRAVARHEEAINPARGIMVGLGLSAMIWASIGALILR